MNLSFYLAVFQRYSQAFRALTNLLDKAGHFCVDMGMLEGRRAEPINQGVQFVVGHSATGLWRWPRPDGIPPVAERFALA